MKNTYKFAKKVGCKREDIADFSSTLNCYRAPLTLTFTASSVANGDAVEQTLLKNTIAQKYALQSEQIALYPGIKIAIDTLLKSLKCKEVFLYAPIAKKYENALKRTKKHIYRINRLEEPMVEPMEDSIVIFSNPSTPEGYYEEDIAALLAMWIEKDCIIIIDESYLAFSGFSSLKSEIQNYKQLYIIQDFAPFYAAAGAPVTAIYAHKKSIKKLPILLAQPSAFDTKFLAWRLEDVAFEQNTDALLKKQKAALEKILHASNIFEEIVESDTNYILTYSPQAKALQKHLKSYNILTQNCGGYHYLSDDWLRFSVQNSAAQDKLKEALHAFA